MVELAKDHTGTWAAVAGHPQSAARVDALPRKQLRAMRDAGRRVDECQRVLAKTGDNVVSEILRHQGPFYEWDHYPKGDVYDRKTHAQYYYHAHPADLRGQEHGHFHTFLRPKGMPPGMAPAPLPDCRPPSDDNTALSHLVAISMDRSGRAIRLFTTNRWVTGETWYAAGDVIKMLEHFRIDQARPSWPVNIWISNILVLFRPEIEALLWQRGAAVADWQRRHHGTNAYEDRRLEIASATAVNVGERIAAIEAAFGVQRIVAEWSTCRRDRSPTR